MGVEAYSASLPIEIEQNWQDEEEEEEEVGQMKNFTLLLAGSRRELRTKIQNDDANLFATKLPLLFAFGTAFGSAAGCARKGIK